MTYLHDVLLRKIE